MKKKEGVWNGAKQYEMIQAALDGSTTNKTITVYKKDVKKFCQWAKANGYKDLKTIGNQDGCMPREGKISRRKMLEGMKAPMLTHEQVSAIKVVKEYADYLEREGHYSPASIHRFLAPVCKALEINMKEVDNKPKRTSGEMSRSRVKQANQQGQKEAGMDKYQRLVKAQRAIGIRCSELARLKGEDLMVDESGKLCVRVRKGKGGKMQYQRILPQHVNTVKELFQGIAQEQKVFSKAEISNKIDLHGMRAELGREAYDYYLERLENEPGYRSKLMKELMDRWDCLHPKGKNETKQFFAYLGSFTDTKPYVLRGDNKMIAENKGLPTEYDRMALMVVSVFHQSHWRIDVTVTNYMLNRRG